MTRSRSPETPSAALLVRWAVVVLVSLFFLLALHQVAPWILEREIRLSHWDLNRLAEERFYRAEELKWLLSHEERTALYREAADYLSRAREARPESRHYAWFHGLALYNTLSMETPNDPEAVQEAVDIIEEAWEMSDRTDLRSGFFLAEHYGRAGRLERAREILDLLGEADPEEVAVYDTRIRVFLDAGEVRYAIGALETKQDRLHLSHSDQAILAKLYFENEDYDLAAKVLEERVRAGGADSHDRLLLAMSLAVEGRYEESFRRLTEYQRDSPYRSDWPSPKSLQVRRFPSEAFPALAYFSLEAVVPSPVKAKKR